MWRAGRYLCALAFHWRGVGHNVSLLAGADIAPALIAMGMAAFLAAVTQAPLTAFIIVMEMVDGHAMVLSLMARPCWPAWFRACWHARSTKPWPCTWWPG